MLSLVSLNGGYFVGSFPAYPVDLTVYGADRVFMTVRNRQLPVAKKAK